MAGLGPAIASPPAPLYNEIPPEARLPHIWEATRDAIVADIKRLKRGGESLDSKKQHKGIGPQVMAVFRARGVDVKYTKKFCKGGRLPLCCEVQRSNNLNDTPDTLDHIEEDVAADTEAIACLDRRRDILEQEESRLRGQLHDLIRVRAALQKRKSDVLMEAKVRLAAYTSSEANKQL